MRKQIYFRMVTLCDAVLFLFALCNYTIARRCASAFFLFISSEPFFFLILLLTSHQKICMLLFFIIISLCSLIYVSPYARFDRLYSCFLFVCLVSWSVSSCFFFCSIIFSFHSIWIFIEKEKFFAHLLCYSHTIIIFYSI